MAKKKRKTKALVRRMVTTARRGSAKTSEVAKKAHSLMTPAAGLSIAAGAAFGSAIGARLVTSGRLTANQTGAVLITTGAAASYLGYRNNSPILFGAGVGTGVSGVTVLTNNIIIERERQKVRNAGYLPDDDNYRDELEDQNDGLLPQ